MMKKLALAGIFSAIAICGCVVLGTIFGSVSTLLDRADSQVSPKATLPRSMDEEPSSPTATHIPPKSKLPPETKIPKIISTLISYATGHLVPGDQYWLSAYEDPFSGPSSWVPIYNLPGEPYSSPAIALIDFIPDASLVTLIGVQDEYCYVKGFGPSLEGFLALPVEGWLTCDLLLTYEPTPIPTRNLTPVPPTILPPTFPDSTSMPAQDLIELGWLCDWDGRGEVALWARPAQPFQNKIVAVVNSVNSVMVVDGCIRVEIVQEKILYWISYCQIGFDDNVPLGWVDIDYCYPDRFGGKPDWASN